MTEVTSERTNFSSETLPENGANSSRNCHLPEIQVFPKEVKFLIHVFTLVVALVGNSLLIAAYRRMKEPVMLLIANMAASDLLTAIFLIPRLITIAIVDSLAWQVHGLAGTVLCKMCTFLSDISLSVSTQSLVIIAVERFIAVVHPLKARSITAKERRLLIASTWIAAMALHSPYFYCMEIVIDNNIPICQNKWITDQQAFLAFNVFFFCNSFACTSGYHFYSLPNYFGLHSKRQNGSAQKLQGGKTKSKTEHEVIEAGCGYRTVHFHMLGALRSDRFP